MATTADSSPDTVQVRGVYFDELEIGQTFDDVPAVTLTDGMQATHSAIVGNRLRIARDAVLAERVTGARSAIASPALVWDTAIGQSTVVTQHVRANLFYRGLRFRRVPEIGDTLSTVTRVEGLKQNSIKPGRPLTGLAALHITTTDQHDRVVLDFWRCAMLPCSPGSEGTDRADDLSALGRPIVDADLTEAVADWDLAAFRDRVPGPHLEQLSRDRAWQIEGADVVTSAPELARLTGNLATVHHDAAAAGGDRLVYGGHTIGIAFHQVCRAIPALVTVLAWDGCDHVGPVHEGDTLRSTITVQRSWELPGSGGIALLRVLVKATRADGSVAPVLDWSLYALLA
ncbi:MaoC family dehydratase [Nocardia miyunensis]|uniref:MaoC family dehydratase n=1 Tax=Nocardia miyunensis TaxID=282684 RepID=UPI000833F699|nr:MaoC family dehydratase [Nocardia miyunensis]